MMERSNTLNIEEQKQFYIDLWKARKPSGMTHSKEEWDMRALNWIDEVSIEGEKKDRSDRRVAETAVFLRSHGLLKKDDEVIDIGCGPGQFVTEFAKTAGYVLGTDISPKMCDFGAECARQAGLINTDFIACDFKEADMDIMGWKGRFDLVFSSITPAMSTYEAFRKAEAMSRGYCFQSNYVKTYDPIGDMVLSEALGREDKIHSRGFSSFMAMFNILYIEEKYPITYFFTEKAEDILRPDDESARKVTKFMMKADLTDELLNKVKKTIKNRSDSNGELIRPMEWTYGWLLWKV